MERIEVIYKDGIVTQVRYPNTGPSGDVPQDHRSRAGTGRHPGLQRPRPMTCEEIVNRQRARADKGLMMGTFSG